MGNLNQILRENTLPNLSIFKTKRRKKTDNFIIDHFQNHKYNERILERESMTLNRVVFISLMGLYQTWDLCPPHLLYSSLFILPLKQKWLYSPFKYKDEIKSNLVSQMSIFSDISRTQLFIELLKWKDSQGLIFWAFNDYNNSTDNTLINPFWVHLSSTLSTLYDAVTQTKYNPLHLDIKWWQNESKFKSKYGTETSSMLEELYFMTMKYKSMQELIYQSNPNVLCPVVSFTSTNNGIRSIELTVNIYQDVDDNECENWWISEDYDPYDMDH